MSTVYNCLNCASKSSSLLANEINGSEDYKISQCRDCDLIFTSYQSIDTNQGYLDFTKDSFYKKYGDNLSGARIHDRDANYLEEVAIISSYLQSGNYLDVGCNAGWLLSYLKRGTALKLHGIEPSPMLSSVCKETLNIPVYNSYVRDGVLPDATFNFVSMTDVFEHLPNPNQVLQILLKSMQPKAYLLIKVPNGAFTLLKYRLHKILPALIQQKDLFNAKEHLGHYTQATLEKVLKQNGFKVLKTYVPKPIQTRGSRPLIVLARTVVYWLSKFGIIPPQDLLVIAQRN